MKGGKGFNGKGCLEPDNVDRTQNARPIAQGNCDGYQAVGVWRLAIPATDMSGIARPISACAHFCENSIQARRLACQTILGLIRLAKHVNDLLALFCRTIGQIRSSNSCQKPIYL